MDNRKVYVSECILNNTITLLGQFTYLFQQSHTCLVRILSSRGILRALPTCIVFSYHGHSLLFLFLVLTYLFISFDSKWSLAISNRQIPSTFKGNMYHHSTNLSGCMLSHSSSGLQNILAAKLFLFPMESLKKKKKLIFEADKSRASVFEAW